LQFFITHFPSRNICLMLLLLLGVCPSNKHCPSAPCAYAANAVGKYLDIFAIGAVSLNDIYTLMNVNPLIMCVNYYYYYYYYYYY
jgi:hypothetical protein